MVICGGIQLVPDREDEVTNPVLLVEVLSDATRNYDRGDKFGFYKSIPSFSEYLVVEQKNPSVEHHVRDEGGSWSSRTHDSLNEVVKLTSTPVELPLAEVYAKVFGPEPSRS